MTQEEIIKMAIDAIGGDLNGQEVQHLAWRLENFKDDVYQFGPDALLKFVSLVAAAEGDTICGLLDRLVDTYENMYRQGSAEDIRKLIRHIRARGQE